MRLATARTGGTYLAAPFWRLVRRIEEKTALAVAQFILVVCWHLLTDDRDHDDRGGDHFARRNPDRHCDRLIARLQPPGYQAGLETVA